MRLSYLVTIRIIVDESSAETIRQKIFEIKIDDVTKMTIVPHRTRWGIPASQNCKNSKIQDPIYLHVGMLLQTQDIETLTKFLESEIKQFPENLEFIEIKHVIDPMAVGQVEFLPDGKPASNNKVVCHDPSYVR